MHPCSRCIHSTMTPVFSCGAGHKQSHYLYQEKYPTTYQYFAPGTGGRIGYYSNCKSFIHKPKQSYHVETQQSISRPDTTEPDTSGENSLGISSSFRNLIVDDDPTAQTVGSHQTKTRFDHYNEVLSRLQPPGHSRVLRPCQPRLSYPCLQAGAG